MALEEDKLREAAKHLREATALVVAAGAGMGVDSGLPDFRGTAGFWKAYPPYAKLGLDFVSMANPSWFRRDPRRAWGFYGHRLMLYRRTEPHAGFGVLLRWMNAMRHGGQVFTSNVDGHFQRAGFAPERVYEVHGSLAALQCTRECGVGLFSSEGVEVQVDEESFLAREPFPRCPRCGGLARPNVLMFGDGEWDSSRTDAQGERFDAWTAQLPQGARGVLVECGAGTNIATVRSFSERAAGHRGWKLLRFNVREPEVPAGQLGFACGALEGLLALDALLTEKPLSDP